MFKLYTYILIALTAERIQSLSSLFKLFQTHSNRHPERAGQAGTGGQAIEGESMNDDGQEIPKEFEVDYSQEILMKKCQHCGVYPGQYHAKDCPERMHGIATDEKG
jgi:hypothetical protein